MEKERKKNLALKISIAAIVVILAGLYFGISTYFSDHFLFNTKINDMDISQYSLDEVVNTMKKRGDNYELTITKDGRKLGQISGEALDLEYKVDREHLKKVLESQNQFLWPVSLFEPTEYVDNSVAVFDGNRLRKKLRSMPFMEAKPTKATRDAGFSYKNGYFDIVKEEYGDELEMYDFSRKLGVIISELRVNADLKEDKLYRQPAISSDNVKLKALVSELNQRLNMSITYENMETIPRETMANFLGSDEDFTVKIDRSKIARFIDDFAEKYDTAGKPKKLMATGIGEVTVPGGSYGWKIDREGEVEELIRNITDGKDITRPCIYQTEAASHGEKDYGDSYVEVNLTTQHLYLYVDGGLVMDTAFVSGNLSQGMGTHTGAYQIIYTQKDATLVGEGYRTPVSYWMPFNGGEGLHDANWRATFGGNIYRTNGSHGCVNLPYGAARTIFNTVKAGFPVLVFTTDGSGSTVVAPPVTPENNPTTAQDAQAAADAAAVINKINAIGAVTLEKEALIVDARNTFNSLTPQAQALVNNLAVLTASEQTLTTLKNQQPVIPPVPVPEPTPQPVPTPTPTPQPAPTPQPEPEPTPEG